MRHSYATAASVSSGSIGTAACARLDPNAKSCGYNVHRWRAIKTFSRSLHSVRIASGRGSSVEMCEPTLSQRLLEPPPLPRPAGKRSASRRSSCCTCTCVLRQAPLHADSHEQSHRLFCSKSAVPSGGGFLHMAGRQSLRSTGRAEYCSVKPLSSFSRHFRFEHGDGRDAAMPRHIDTSRSVETVLHAKSRHFSICRCVVEPRIRLPVTNESLDACIVPVSTAAIGGVTVTGAEDDHKHHPRSALSPRSGNGRLAASSKSAACSATSKHAACAASSRRVASHICNQSCHLQQWHRLRHPWKRERRRGRGRGRSSADKCF